MTADARQSNRLLSNIFIENGWLTGWAYDPFLQDLNVELLNDKTVVSSAKTGARLNHEDFLKIGIPPKESCGFRVLLPFFAMDGFEYKLEIKIKEWRLPSDPKPIEFIFVNGDICGEAILQNGKYIGWVAFRKPQKSFFPITVHTSRYSKPIFHADVSIDIDSATKDGALKAFFSINIDSLPKGCVLKYAGVELRLKNEPSNSKIVGKLDKVSADGISGFIIDVDNPSRTLNAYLMIDGAPIKLIQPNERRPSIAEYLNINVSDLGVSGFRYQLPQTIFDGQKHKISLVSKETGKLLTDGEQESVFEPIGIKLSELLSQKQTVGFTSVNFEKIKPLVSVVILNRNGEEILPQLFDSWHKHNTVNVEIIIIDHASTDDSLPIIDEWSKCLPIRLIELAYNDSFSASCNRGALLAQGEYILFLNNDIIWLQDALCKMLDSFKDENVGIVGIKLIKQEGDFGFKTQHLGVRFKLVGTQYWPYEVTSEDEAIDCEFSPQVVPAVTGAALLCRKVDFTAIGGFDERYFYGFEDVELCLRMKNKIDKISVCRNDLTALHKHGYTRLSGREKTVFDRLEHNAKTISGTLGLWLKHKARKALYGGDKNWSKESLNVAFVISDRVSIGEENQKNEILPVAAAVAEALPYSSVLFLTPDINWYAVKNIHILIVCTPLYDLRQLTFRCGDLACIALFDLEIDKAAWQKQPSWKLFDLYASKNGNMQIDVGYPLIGLRADGDDIKNALATLCRQIRVAVVVPISKKDSEFYNGWQMIALQLCETLKGAGVKAQTFCAEEWDNIPFVVDIYLQIQTSSSQYPAQIRRDAVNMLWLLDGIDGICKQTLQKFDHIFIASESATKKLKTKYEDFSLSTLYPSIRAQSELKCAKKYILPKQDATIDYTPVCYPNTHYIINGELYPRVVETPTKIELYIHEDDYNNGFLPWSAWFASEANTKVLIGKYSKIEDVVSNMVKTEEWTPPKMQSGESLVKIMHNILEGRIGYSFYTS